MKAITICLPRDAYEEGKTQAKAQDRTFSNYLRHLISLVREHGLPGSIPKNIETPIKS